MSQIDAALLGGRACLVLSNVLGRAEDIEALERVVEREEVGARMPWLVDNRDAGMIPGIREIKRLVRFLELHEQPISRTRIALVVSDAASYGMGRVLQARTEHLLPEVRPFRHREAAIEWIASTAG